MKLWLTAAKQLQRLVVCVAQRRCLSSGASSPVRDAELVVGSRRELAERLGSQVEVRTAFISEEEEQALLRELEPGLRKKRYEFDHWDDVGVACFCFLFLFFLNVCRVRLTSDLVTCVAREAPLSNLRILCM